MLTVKDLKKVGVNKYHHTIKVGKILYGALHGCENQEFFIPTFVNKHVLLKIGRQVLRDQLIEHVAKRQKICSECKLPIFAKEIHGAKQETLQRFKQTYLNGAFLLAEKPLCCRCSFKRLQQEIEREALALKQVRKQSKRYLRLIKKYQYETREIVEKL